MHSFWVGLGGKKRLLWLGIFQNFLSPAGISTQTVSHESVLSSRQIDFPWSVEYLALWDELSDTVGWALKASVPLVWLLVFFVLYCGRQSLDYTPNWFKDQLKKVVNPGHQLKAINCRSRGGSLERQHLPSFVWIVFSSFFLFISWHVVLSLANTVSKGIVYSPFCLFLWFLWVCFIFQVAFELEW